MPRNEIDDRFVDRPADALGAPGGGHALVTTDDRDDRPEDRRLQHRPPQVGDRGVGEQRVPERPQRAALVELGEQAAEEAEQDGVDVEQAGDHHQRQEAGDDEVLDRVHAQHLQRVELLAHLAGAEVGGDRGAGHPGQHDRGDQRPDFADRRQHEEAAEAIERAEQRQEVARLQPRGSVADGDGGDQQRQPAEPQREQELRHELPAVGVGRGQRRPDRLARQDHHVPEFLEHMADGHKGPLCSGANHPPLDSPP